MKQYTLLFKRSLFLFIIICCRVFKLAKIGVVVLGTFAICWSPFLNSKESALQVVRRLFPFGRGLYEVRGMGYLVKVVYIIQREMRWIWEYICTHVSVVIQRKADYFVGCGVNVHVYFNGCTVLDSLWLQSVTRT